MPTSYDAAVAELYRAALDAFVAERKRLSSELKGGGDKAGAARLSKLARPTVSAWAVNQLFWHERGAFDELLATAQRLREGDLGATGAHREALAVLRERAAAVLGDAGHAPSDATLRRVTTSLSALAAAGGFDPDPPGALARDRDPPGFEAAEPVGQSAYRAATAKGTGESFPAAAVQTDAARERAAAEAERRRLEEERKQRAERERLEAAVDKAKRDVDARLRDVDRLRRELAEAEARLERARTVANELEASLSAFERVD